MDTVTFKSLELPPQRDTHSSLSLLEPICKHIGGEEGAKTISPLTFVTVILNQALSDSIQVKALYVLFMVQSTKGCLTPSAVICSQEH